MNSAFHCIHGEGHRLKHDKLCKVLRLHHVKPFDCSFNFKTAIAWKIYDVEKIVLNFMIYQMS